MTRQRAHRLAAATAALLMLSAGAAWAQQPVATPPAADDVAAARKAAGALGAALRDKLGAAMKEGGPIAALGVCNTSAPGIASQVSADAGLKVGRTALKLRNPANAPDALEKATLEDFAKKLEAGADPATLEHAEIVSVGGKKTLRFIKAIPTGEPCLACHGAEVKPDVAAEIKRLYPEDAATGFKQGSLRGAFTISKPVE